MGDVMMMYEVFLWWFNVVNGVNIVNDDVNIVG